MTTSKENLLLLLVLLLASLLVGIEIPEGIAYVAVAAVYGIVLIICFVRGRLGIAYSRTFLYLIGVLWAIFVLNVALNPTPRSLLRGISFIVFSALTLFVVPGTFSREEFIDALSIVAVAVGLVAIPIGASTLLSTGSGFGVYATSGTLLGTGIELPVLMSIFENPNYLATLSALGLVASFGLADGSRRREIAILFGGVCLLSLVLSQGRAGFLALVGGGIVYIVYRIGGARFATPVVVLGILCAALFFVFAVVSIGGLRVPESVLNNRQGLWSAAIAAISERPFLGWGLIDTPQILADHGAPTPAGHVFGTHNSYLRMFLISGISGGVLYLGAIGYTLYRSLRVEENSQGSAGLPLALLVVVLIIHMFNGSTIFGLSFVSLFSALVIGYGQQPSNRINITRKYSEISKKICRQLEVKI
ncbi:O-antigen ligase family protein [Halococcus hamelinensis]|nr:O-antigen ligase family protein [Halococcus hamelinensis]